MVTTQLSEYQMDDPVPPGRNKSSSVDKNRAERLYRGNQWCKLDKFLNWRVYQKKTVQEKRAIMTLELPKKTFLGNTAQAIPRTASQTQTQKTQTKGLAPPVASKRIGEGVERKPLVVDLRKGIPKKHLGTIELTDSESDDSAQPPPKRLRQKHHRPVDSYSRASGSSATAASSKLDGKLFLSDSDDESDSGEEGRQTDSRGDESWNDVMQDILTLINQTRDPKTSQSQPTALPTPPSKTHQTTVLGKRKERFADLDYSDSECEELSASEVRDRTLEDAIIFHRQRLKVLTDRQTTEERAKEQLAKQFRVIEKDVQKNLSKCQRRMQRELEAVIRGLKQDGETSMDVGEGLKKRKEP
ncbi:hypothetical protein ONZ45_g11026 [Pleurotus djamor]|nr:hypothetical protein ONZ45_g11026 [Pleurotus djamor]